MTRTTRTLTRATLMLVALALAAAGASAQPVLPAPTAPLSAAERAEMGGLMPPRVDGPPKTIAVLLFPDFTPLDAVGPYQMLAGLRRAGHRVVIVAAEAGLVESDSPMALRADESFASVGPVDVLIVPGGGRGPMVAARDTATTAFVRRVYDSGAIVASVCTGAWILAGAGVLQPGDTASTHWAGDTVLATYGVRSSGERVHRAGRVWSAGGVASGIDLGLALVAEIAGPEQAERTRLALEYAPAPDPAAATPAGTGGAVAEATDRLMRLYYQDAAAGLPADPDAPAARAPAGGR